MYTETVLRREGMRILTKQLGKVEAERLAYVSVKIKATDEEGRPVVTHLGVSVYDPFYDNPDDPDNIFVHTYLSSQIRGKVFSP